jgi:signal transduction histidine kinase
MVKPLHDNSGSIPVSSVEGDTLVAWNNRMSDATAKDRLIEELREAVTARDDFLAVAAHELKNPLTPISCRWNLFAWRRNLAIGANHRLNSIDWNG